MDSDALKLLWISLELAVGTTVVITLLAVDTMPKSRVELLVAIGAICFCVSLLGLGLVRSTIRKIVAFAAIWISMALCGWAAWPVLAASAETVSSLHAPAGSGGGRLLYGDSAPDGVITPVQLLVKIRITNDTGEGILIASYDVEAREGWVKWRHLSRLDGNFGQVYSCLNTTKDCRLLEQNSLLDMLLFEKAIAPHMSVVGWVPLRDEWPSRDNRLADLRIIVRDTKKRKTISYVDNGEEQESYNMQGASFDLAPGFFDLTGRKYVPPESPIPHSY